jgi:uncharacterized membrane-anchored protein
MSAPTAYQMLLYVVQTARSIPNATKKSLLQRIESNEWDDAMRLQLRDLCATEAMLRKKEAAELRADVRELEDAISAASPDITSEQEELVTDFNAENSAIVAAFKQEADATERGLDRAIEQDAKTADTSEIGALRSFLKNDDNA